MPGLLCNNINRGRGWFLSYLLSNLSSHVTSLKIWKLFSALKSYRVRQQYFILLYKPLCHDHWKEFFWIHFRHRHGNQIQKVGVFVLIPWTRNHRLRGEVKLSFQNLHCVDGCRLKEFAEDFLKKKTLIKKNPHYLIRFTAALFSWLLHMIFCLSPLLPVCSDGTVPTRKLDGPCCRDARCRMNTWTTGKISGLQTLPTASETRLHFRKHFKKKTPNNPTPKEREIVANFQKDVAELQLQSRQLPPRSCVSVHWQASRYWQQKVIKS